MLEPLLAAASCTRARERESGWSTARAEHPREGTVQHAAATSRHGSLLRTLSADVRSTDDVIEYLPRSSQQVVKNILRHLVLLRYCLGWLQLDQLGERVDVERVHDLHVWVYPHDIGKLVNLDDPPCKPDCNLLVHKLTICHQPVVVTFLPRCQELGQN